MSLNNYWQTFFTAVLFLTTALPVSGSAGPVSMGAHLPQHGINADSGMVGVQRELGTITGQIALKGNAPLSGASIFLFNAAVGPPPSAEYYWRIPDVIEKPDKEGKFSIEVPEGKYYVVAISRVVDKEIGPPQHGDSIYELVDVKGNPRLATITRGSTLNVGTINKTLTLSKETAKFDKGVTAAEGVVVDSEGVPAVGIVVLAFAVPSAKERPLYISDRTGKDGRFIVRIKDGGSYLLRARDIYGIGPASEGEQVLEYDEGAPVPVSLKKGERVKGVTLKVNRRPGRDLQGKRE